MPRAARLDAPGVLHHVMVRGIEGRRIFHDDTDRADFCRRLAALVAATGLTVYAWALLPNHAHLLLKTGARPLARVMRSLLTGHAGAFNRRHRRRGHLFQNRYKSIVVEAEVYLLELVRYLHLNPLRAGVVPDLIALETYPWSGHAALLGRVACTWQAIGEVLGQFPGSPRGARRRYRAFVEAAASRGRRPELQGGGLVRSAGGWTAVRALRRGREAYAADERILGHSAFVERLRATLPDPAALKPRVPPLEAVVSRVCAVAGANPAQVSGGARTPAACEARAGIAYLWTEVYGRAGRPLAAALGITPAAVYAAARRGAAAAKRWSRLAIRQN